MAAAITVIGNVILWLSMILVDTARPSAPRSPWVSIVVGFLLSGIWWSPVMLRLDSNQWVAPLFLGSILGMTSAYGVFLSSIPWEA